jgi:hypothetical protein
MRMNEPTPLDFLKAVYLNEGLPLSVRMKAAIEAAPYVHPKLSATAVMTSEDFGDRLERAILRSIGARRALTKPELPRASLLDSVTAAKRVSSCRAGGNGRECPDV